MVITSIIKNLFVKAMWSSGSTYIADLIISIIIKNLFAVYVGVSWIWLCS